MTPPLPMTPNALHDLTQRRRLIVCVGSGGVGKTTTSAVIALHAALEGRKVLVLTIDPAKRLANSLGVDGLDDTARPIPLERFEAIGLRPKGQLSAMMLDMKSAFDRLVQRHAPDEVTRQKILNNRFYNYFSSSLAGTQEYSAMERVHELYLNTDYELIVLDTPPTTHTLDFLDAPKRLFDALDSSALQWLLKPGRLGFDLLNLGASYVFKVLSKFTGGGFLQELSEFLQDFSSMWDGFKARAARTRQILAGPDVAFFVVTSPDPLTLQEALFFHRRLSEEAMPIAGLIVNRVHQPFVPNPVLAAPITEIHRRLAAALPPDALPPDTLPLLSTRLQDNAREFHILAHQDEATLDRLDLQLGRTYPIYTVPFFSTDIFSLQGLERLRQALFRLAATDAADHTPGRF
jgi:anion-transporting  ArsA/GET3 family ATPase